MIPAINIDIASLNIFTLVPMLVAIAGALTILVIDLASKTVDKSLYVILTVVFLLIDFGVVAGSNVNNPRGMFDVMLVDGIAVVAQMIIILASALFIFLALSQQKFHEYRYPEYFALFLFMIAGFQFMVSSDNLIQIFVGLETASLALYTLIAMHNRDKSFEAAVKYFTMGALAAGFFAFGSMIFYALTGSVELHIIASELTMAGFEPYPVVLVGVAFILAALAFKLSLVPFHIWAPDVYDGSSSALAGYMSIVPKIAGFVVALRFFEMFVASHNMWVYYVLYTMVVITITIPNMIALLQTDVKRMLAYSSVSHAGFVMATILIGTSQATSAMFLYWMLFAFTNLGSFSMLWIFREKKRHAKDHPFEKFSGLIKISPFSAMIMGLFMLSLAGVPPFSLFWGKMFIISTAVNADELGLAVIMALNSAVAAYYYLKLIVFMFLKDPIKESSISFVGNSNNTLRTVIGISALITITSMAFIDPLLDMINYYVAVSGY